jgi:hypothetical protein
LDIIDQYCADGNPQQRASGHFHAADPGEVIPAGSVEITIKVPTGLNFLHLPEVLKFVEARSFSNSVNDAEGVARRCLASLVKPSVALMPASPY